MQIYLARNNVQAGPYSLEELNRMLAGGQVQLTDLAWHEGMSQWQPLGQLTQGQRIYQPAAAAPWPTPAPSPLSLEKTPASPTDAPAAAMTTQVTELRISSLYKRISASVVDLCAFLVTMAPILQHLSMDVLLSEDLNRVQQAVETLPQQDVLVAAVLMLGLLVAQCALTVKRGQTLGKLLLGTRIVDQQTGQVPTVTQVLWVRTVAFNLLYNLPLIGPLVFIADVVALLLSPQRLSLHDRAAKTVVVDVQPLSQTSA